MKIKYLIKKGLMPLLAVFCYVTSFADSTMQWLDYETGTFFEGLSYDESLRPDENFAYETEYSVIELNIKCAGVEPSPWYEGCVRWWFPAWPNFIWTDEEGKPEVTTRAYPYYIEKEYKSATFTVLEAEYKDFNYKLQRAMPPLPDNGESIDPAQVPDITPYEGFYPDQPVYIRVYNSMGYRNVTVIVYPIAYDYEHQIVRAYTHLKIRIDHIKDEAGIEEVGADDAPAEYFNLQGIKVEKPEHGVYIERKGGKATKVVY